MEPVEQKGDDSQKYIFNPVEPFQKHRLQGSVNDYLDGRAFIGVDGANDDVKREELILLKARGVSFIYPFTSKISKSKLDHPSRGFYILKPSLLQEGYEEYVEVEDEAKKAVDVEAVEAFRWMFLRYARGADSSNPYMQAMGATVKMMQLSEIAVARKAVDRVIDSGVEASNVHLLFDGSLPPKSIKPETYTQEFLRGKSEDQTPLLNRNIKIYSVVKRISSSRLFVELLKEKQELCEELLDIDAEELEYGYITDAALMRDILQPGEYTSFIRYRVKGKTAGGDVNVPQDVVPAASYVMTEEEEIFRVEFPSYYLDNGKGDHKEGHEIMSAFLSLTRENNGGLPTPNVFADNLASYSQSEKKAADAILESWATDKLDNLNINPVYGNF